MSKLTLSDITNPENQNTMVGTINANNALIEGAFENTLSRDGAAPNMMLADLDMNSQRVLNLPDALSNSEPMTLGQFNEQVSLGPTGTYTAPGTGAVIRSLNDKLTDFVSVADFGAVPNSSGAAAANTTAFNAAVSAYKSIYVPEGTWYISGTINLDNFHGQSVRGAGRDATVLMSTSTSLPVFSIQHGMNFQSITDMTIQRNVVAVAGGHGIHAVYSCDNVLLENLRVGGFELGHYVGINVSHTGYSRIVNCTIEHNISDGIYMSHHGLSGTEGSAFQWNLTNVNVGVNGGNGIHVNSAGSLGGSAMGDWTHIASFGNTGNAFRFQGATNQAIHSIRIHGAFVGGEMGGAGSVLFATYSGSTFVHQITDLYSEASNYGIYVTANNGPIQFTNPNMVTSNNHGMQWESTSECTVNGGLFSANGVTAGGVGISMIAGKLTCVGANFGNTSGVTSQSHGISFAVGTGPHCLIGNNFLYATGNSVAPIIDSSLNNASVYRGNRGLSDVIPSGTGFTDTNYNELLTFTTTASAVNELNITNAATGNAPTITATGGDANVGIALQPKAGGSVQVKGTASGPAAIQLFEATGNGTNSLYVTAPASISADRILTLPAPSASDELVSRTSTDTLTNKTINGSNNTITNVSLTTGVTGDLPYSNLTQGSARSVLGVTGNSTADVASIQGTTDQVFRVNQAGTALSFGPINVASASAVTGLLPYANGGNAQDLNTAWTNYNPSPTHVGGSGTWTGNGNAWYKIIGKIAYVVFTITTTAYTAPTGVVRINAPPGGNVLAGRIGVGSTFNTTQLFGGNCLGGLAAATVHDLYRYDGTFPFTANSQTLWGFTIYEVA